MVEAKNFDYLLEKHKGISDKQLQAHFGLYLGYVKKLNEIREKLTKTDPSLSNYSFGEFSELKRREAVAFNGTYLHELYFENLESKGPPSEKLKEAVAKSWGTWDKFEADIKGSASSTPGWVVVTYDWTDQKLHTYILFEHHIGLPVHQCVVLALDCWEHAFMIDYGTNKTDYLKAFLQNINWEVVSKRYEEVLCCE